MASGDDGFAAARMHALPVFFLAVGVSLAVALFITLNRGIDNKTRSSFVEAARTHETALRRSIAFDLEALLAVKGLFDSSTTVTRAEFSTFVKPLLDRHPTLQALEWIPRVHHTERRKYEQAARADGIEGFTITEREIRATMRRAKRRLEYFPVFYTEPLAGNERALGFDMASDPRRLHALELARATGEPHASPPIALVQDDVSANGFVTFVPIYRDGPTRTLAERQRNLAGFVLAVHRIEALIAHSKRGLPENAAIGLSDITSRASSEELYSERQEPAGARTAASLEYSAQFVVAGRTWEMTVRPAAGAFNLGFHLEALVALMLGLGLAFTLSRHMWKLQRTNQAIASQAAKQTELVLEREHELSIQRRLYEDVVQNQDEFIVRFLPDTTLTFVNRAYCEHYGKSEEELLGVRFIELVPPHERERVLKSLSQVRTGEHNAFERTEPTPDGRITWQQWHRSCIEGPDGEICEFQAVGRDITDMKRREFKLERANEDLERFASIASHDLREPLRKIEAANSILMEDLGQRLTDEDREWLEIASNGAVRMRAMIEDLLDLSRVGQYSLERADVRLNEPLEDALGALGTQIEEAQASISYENLPMIPVEPRLLRQVFQNLLSNAIKYRGEERPAIQIECEERRADWLVSVADNGIGIDPVYADRIFEIFKRLHCRTEYSGTGIGLAICKRIVERHGGRIWLDERRTHGSRFYFTIAKVPPAESVGDPAQFPSLAIVQSK